MIVLISPAKSVDFESPVNTEMTSQPDFVEESTKLIKKLNTFSGKKLGELMKISPELVALNMDRYKKWTPTPLREDTKQAMLAFNGEVFRGLNASEMNDGDLDFAQGHLRILSGLYGVLRPMDLIQPYRLEMGTKLKYYSANNLYQFWGDKITERLNIDLDSAETVVNLASTEYFKSVQQPKLKAQVITPIFKEFSNGEYKIKMTYAKNARGTMANYIIKNKIEDVEQIKAFDTSGYVFNPSMSTDTDWVFTRG
ncbi:peroxide stress protein YaaA [Reichenbachiella versicolor]|uniref:peroxide stress protein YaaA n=1 Tax=Reichenbachiella versicolor TaxID=1821036 RepID=UPI000D6EA9C4|nr:peroxide stress protein YaaA [Reichenbachiella versicolor]